MRLRVQSPAAILPRPLHHLDDCYIALGLQLGDGAIENGAIFVEHELTPKWAGRVWAAKLAVGGRVCRLSHRHRWHPVVGGRQCFRCLKLLGENP